MYSPTSVEELRHLWVRAQPELSTDTWGKSKGPLRRAVLSLRRCGWDVVDPFIWTDDVGTQIRLKDHSPKMMADLLRASLDRRARAAAADKLLGRFGGTVATAGIRKNFLNSTRRSPYEKWIAKAVCTQAMWTADRLDKCGYAGGASCGLCGGQDGVHHRLWVCPAHRGLRHRLAGPFITRRAKEEKDDEPVWSTGLPVLRPEVAEMILPPCVDGGVVYTDPDGTEVAYDNWWPTSYRWCELAL